MNKKMVLAIALVMAFVLGTFSVYAGQTTGIRNSPPDMLTGEWNNFRDNSSVLFVATSSYNSPTCGSVGSNFFTSNVGWGENVLHRTDREMEFRLYEKDGWKPLDDLCLTVTGYFDENPGNGCYQIVSYSRVYEEAYEIEDTSELELFPSIYIDRFTSSNTSDGTYDANGNVPNGLFRYSIWVD